MKAFVTPHCHVKSLDSASSPEKFAQRELELGTGYLTVTDHGTLEATRQVYDLLRDKKAYSSIKPILGLEGYFRDDNCSILAGNNAARSPDGTFRDAIKYTHITLHAMDEPAYSTLSKVLSQADLRAEKHGQERKPLFTWENLEELGAQNMTATSGCLIGMVGRHLLKNNDFDSAVKYYRKLRSVFKPGNFYVEIFPHVCDRNWEVKITVTDSFGKQTDYPYWKKVKTLGAPDGIKLEELATQFKTNAQKAAALHTAIVEVTENRKSVPLAEPLMLVNVVRHEGWLHNECRPWSPDGDVQLGVNKFLLKLAAMHNDPVLISDDSHFAFPEEKIVQDIRLGQNGTWKFSNSHHRMSTDEALDYFKSRMDMSEGQVEKMVETSHEWASRFRDFKFGSRKSLPTSFYPENTLKHTLALIKHHGRMDWTNPERVARLDAEINLLYKNGTVDLLPYFMIDEEVCRLYAKNGLLTGPGRGSAAGLSLAYYLGITHCDPMKYKLSMDRFLTIDRVQTGKLPDIDQDLPSRDLLVGTDEQGGWLQKRFGDHVAQISTDTTMKLKSAIKDTFRAMDREAGNPDPKVPDHIEAFCKGLPNPPQGIPDRDYVFGYKDNDGHWIPGLLETDVRLQEFTTKYPKEWNVVQMLLGLPRQKSRHACAYVISDSPISSFIPLMTVGGVRVTSFTAAGVEAAGGLKMDFLVVNSILDIGRALKLVRDRHTEGDMCPEDEDGIPYVEIKGKKVPLIRAVPFNGEWVDVWDLPEDPDVFKDICEGRVETVFQFDAGAARQGLKYFHPEPGTPLPLSTIEGLSAFTALDRPGPLDANVKDEFGNEHNMLVEYSNRARGQKAIGNLPVLDKLLPETYGVIVYQEQLQYVFQTIGNTTAIEANNFRNRISKKKMVEVNKIDKPLFMKGAIESLGLEVAEVLWSQMQTFGQYGFNKSHAVCYVTIAYACAWLKHHYPLEWWCAVLSNADRNEIDEKFWRYCGHLIALPDIQMSKHDFTIEGTKIRAPLSLLKGLGEKAHQQLLAGAPYESIQDLLAKVEAWRVNNPRVVNRKDKKTGEVRPTACKGVSALNATVLQNLIVSGSMDSLFPNPDDPNAEPLATVDQLTAFAFAFRDANPKAKFVSIASKFDLESPLVQYQLRKKILPAFSQPLLPLVSRRSNQISTKTNSFLTFNQDLSVKAEWKLVSGTQFKGLEALGPLEGNLNVCMLGYVVGQRLFDYVQKTTGDKKTACELDIDVDGTRIQLVRWPSKDGLPEAFKENLAGAVVASQLVRGAGSTSFFLADVTVLAPPLKNKAEEEEESPL